MSHAIGYYDLREWAHAAGRAAQTAAPAAVALVADTAGATPRLATRAGFVQAGVLHYWQQTLALLTGDAATDAARRTAAEQAHQALREWLDERLDTVEAVVHLPPGSLVRGYAPFRQFDPASYTWQPADPDAAPPGAGEVGRGPDA